MVLSKLDLAFVALLVAGLLWIEHGNRIVTGSLAAARALPAKLAACPVTDDMPFSADCIKSIDAALPATVRALTSRVASNPAPGPDASARACSPGNQNAGDSTQCLSFLPDGASRP